MPQTEEVQCPLCSSKVSSFHINLTSDLLMCLNESCSYPFETEDITKFIMQNDEQMVLSPSLEIKNDGNNNVECSSSTTGDLLFDFSPFENSNDLTFASPIFPNEKNGEITDLSQFDEILNNFSMNNNNLTTDSIDILLNEIDFSSTLNNDVSSNNLNQVDLNIMLPSINNNESEIIDKDWN